MKGAIIMPVKQKVATDEKIRIAKLCLSGKLSQREAARQVGVRYMTVHSWVVKYKFQGELGFVEQEKNQVYSNELKQAAVNDYLSGIGSQQTIASKYGLRSRTQLQNWIKMYNSHEKLPNSGAGGTTIMTKGRKTTFEERIEIASYCIAHDRNYANTAEKFNVSYQQARNYTVKYESKGIDGLQDNRGKRKDGSTMTELERLRAENKLLRAQKEHAEMEVSFLKKLEEIERRWG
jgi:transposase-like protein